MMDHIPVSDSCVPLVELKQQRVLETNDAYIFCICEHKSIIAGSHLENWNCLSCVIYSERIKTKFPPRKAIKLIAKLELQISPPDYSDHNKESFLLNYLFYNMW